MEILTVLGVRIDFSDRIFCQEILQVKWRIGYWQLRYKLNISEQFVESPHLLVIYILSFANFHWLQELNIYKCSIYWKPSRALISFQGFSIKCQYQSFIFISISELSPKAFIIIQRFRREMYKLTIIVVNATVEKTQLINSNFLSTMKI